MTEQRSGITIKGSAAIIRDYLNYSFNLILHQREILPPEKFTTTKKYGLDLYATNDEWQSDRIFDVLYHTERWISEGKCIGIKLALVDVATDECLEHWYFDFKVDSNVTDVKSHVSRKSAKEIEKEIRAIMIQITSTIGFLPVLKKKCRFRMIVRTKGEVELPPGWRHCDDVKIENGETLALRSFSTGIQSVASTVTFKN